MRHAWRTDRPARMSCNKRAGGEQEHQGDHVRSTLCVRKSPLRALEEGQHCLKEQVWGLVWHEMTAGSLDVTRARDVAR